MAVLMVLSVGAAAYVALGSVTGGSSDRQAESTGASLTDDGTRTESSDAADPATGPVDDPTPSAAASSTPAATRAVARRATATRSTTPEDSAPPSTSLSAAYPVSDGARFTFTADEGATFSCSLDGGAFTPCTSPTSYTDLAPGWHTFAVRATDSAGNVDASPAGTRWHARDGRSTGQ